MDKYLRKESEKVVQRTANKQDTELVARTGDEFQCHLVETSHRLHYSFHNRTFAFVINIKMCLTINELKYFL
jgi:hypothetical protein